MTCSSLRNVFSRLSFSRLTRLASASCVNSTSTAGPSLVTVVASEHSNEGHRGVQSYALGLLFGGLIGASAAHAEHPSSANERDARTELSDKTTGAGWSLISFETRQRVFFKYEKRIRDLSAPEKVFEYFSSREKDGEKFMAATDLLRSVIATYPPQGSSMERAGSLPGERTPHLERHSVEQNIFQQLDVDADGLLSFPEYLLLITLLSIPVADIQAVFDVLDMDGSGDVDFQEFTTVIHLLQAKATRHLTKYSSKLLSDSLKPGGLFVSFFGENQKDRLRVKQLLQFLLSLHEEMDRLEFAHYDWQGHGYISGTDFARSLVVAADIQTVDRLLAKVDALDTELASAHITFEDFSSVAHMRSTIDRLSVGLEFCKQVGRKVVKAEFATLIKKLCGVDLRAQVVDVMFGVYGMPDGSFDIKTFLEVMKRREWMAGKQVRQDLEPNGSAAVIPHKVSKYWNCVKACAMDNPASG